MDAYYYYYYYYANVTLLPPAQSHEPSGILTGFVIPDP
jgi:hypothetical protein